MVIYKIYRINGGQHTDEEFYMLRANAVHRLTELQNDSRMVYGLESFEAKDGDEFIRRDLK